MAKHKLEMIWEVVFENGEIRELEHSDRVYGFDGQKTQYLTLWLENLIKKYSIESKPIEIREKRKVIECEPYQIVLGM